MQQIIVTIDTLDGLPDSLEHELKAISKYVADGHTKGYGWFLIDTEKQGGCFEVPYIVGVVEQLTRYIKGQQIKIQTLEGLLETEREVGEELSALCTKYLADLAEVCKQRDNLIERFKHLL